MEGPQDGGVCSLRNKGMDRRSRKTDRASERNKDGMVRPHHSPNKQGDPPLEKAAAATTTTITTLTKQSKINKKNMPIFEAQFFSHYALPSDPSLI